MNDITDDEIRGLVEIAAIGVTKVYGGDYKENYKKAWRSMHDPFIGCHDAANSGLLIMAGRITGTNIRCMPHEDKDRIRVYSDDKPYKDLNRFWNKFRELRECHKSRDTN